MCDFIDINEFENMLEEIASTIPAEFYNKLNFGIVLEENVKFHPEAINNDLCILGQYVRERMGNHIVIYYGSFKHIMKNASNNEIYEKLREVLIHEFTHHLEYLSKNRDLEIDDEIKLNEYKRKHGIL